MPTYSISKPPKLVISSPKIPKPGSFKPVLVAPVQPERLNTPPSDILNPCIPFATKTDSKTLTWSDEPCDFDPDKPPSHSLPQAAKFGPRDFSSLCSGSDPWKMLQHQKGQGQPQPHRTSHFWPQKPQYYQNPPMPSFGFPNFIHTPYPPAFSSSIQTNPLLLNWDQDPRLADLSHALKALGWV